MSYKIIVDSCGELTEEMKASGHYETASLQIDVGGHHIVDDETFDQASFLKIVARLKSVPNHLVRLLNGIWKGITVKRSMFMQ